MNATCIVQNSSDHTVIVCQLTLTPNMASTREEIKKESGRKVLFSFCEEIYAI